MVDKITLYLLAEAILSILLFTAIISIVYFSIRGELECGAIMTKIDERDREYMPGFEYCVQGLQPFKRISSNPDGGFICLDNNEMGEGDINGFPRGIGWIWFGSIGKSIFINEYLQMIEDLRLIIHEQVMDNEI